MLYAVGVLQVDVDASGNVLRTALDARAQARARSHRRDRAHGARRRAVPGPAARIGKVTYTDTWLWDKSGRFQLDTLTEGQLGDRVCSKLMRRLRSRGKSSSSTG